MLLNITDKADRINVLSDSDIDESSNANSYFIQVSQQSSFNFSTPHSDGKWICT